MPRPAEKILTLFLRGLAATWRLKIEGKLPPERCIIAFWHGSMLPVWKHFAGTDASAVVSRSKDGSLLATLLESWSYDVIRGSSSKGGKEVLAAMTGMAQIKKVLVTPDGPRGPKAEMKAGAVIAAMRSGAALSCCSVQISWKITLNSWDKFAVPLPFTKIKLHFYHAVTYSPTMTSDEVEKAIADAAEKLGKWP